MSFRLCLACACVVAFMAITTVNADIRGNSNTQSITVVKDIRNFARSHPNMKLLRLSKEHNRARSGQSVRYTLGGRVSGDRLVAQGSDVFSYPARKDVTIQLTYPEAGTGSIVTYVEIACEQDSNDGNAYVVAGGIGQRFISIVVEANQTEKFSYTAQFYGSN